MAATILMYLERGGLEVPTGAEEMLRIVPRDLANAADANATAMREVA